MHQLFAAVLAVGSLAVPSIAAAQTSPDCTTIISLPYTISAPGHYCLKDNLSTNLIGGAINITSSNVTLDCRGRSMTHTDPANDATGIGAGSVHPITDVVVRSCKIINFATGINFIPRSERIEIINNEVVAPSHDGIVLWGNNSRITGNSVVGAFDRMGIGYVRTISLAPFEPGIRSTGNVISNNMITGARANNAVWGIRVDMAQDVTVNNNHITGLLPDTGGFAVSISIDSVLPPRVISNVMMSRDANATGISAGGAICSRNIAIGLVTGGYEWCGRSVNNTTVP
jgi:hypothetical protein